MKALQIFSILFAMSFGFLSNLQAQCQVFFTATHNMGVVTFVANTSGNNPSSSIYTWDYGDGQSGSGGPTNIHQYLNNGTYYACVTVLDSLGCTSSFCDTITVNLNNGGGNPCSNVYAAFTYNTTPNGTHFTSTYTGFSSPIWYYWDFGNGITSTSANPTLVLPNGGHAVFLTVSDSLCNYTYMDSIFVGGGNPCSGFNASFQQVVNGSTVTFTSSTTGGTPAYAYQWNFGDGSFSTQANPSHTYANPGTYNVYLVVTDAAGCNYTVFYAITITAPCNQNSATLTLHFDNYAPETSWDLRGLNGTVVASGSGYSYNQNGSTLTIPLCLATGCYTLNIYDSYGDGMCCLYGNGSYTLTSGGVVLASGGSFAYNETTTICVGGATNPCANSFALFTANNNSGTVLFAATSNLPNPQYVWNFGNGMTGSGSSVTHTYPYTSNTGYYVVCVTAYGSNGCHVTYCDSIAITPQSCTNNLVTLALNFDNFAYETTWNITDANNNIVVSGSGYTPNQNGTTLYQNFCLPTGCYNFNIYDSYGDGICCAWGNGSYSLTNANGVILASGGHFTYQENTNFCVGGATNPCAYFHNNTFTYSINPNGVVTFTPHYGGQSPMNYFWDFGNGTTSNSFNPSTTYTANGYYTVCMTADSAGCSTTYCNTIVITGNSNSGPCANLSLNMNITQDPQNPFNLFMQPVVNGAPANSAFDFVWDFGDGTGTFMGYPSHQYNNFGTYVVCVMAIDSFYGCAATFCDTITIDSSGNFSRTTNYKDVKPGFTVGTQTAIINYITSVNAIATEDLDMELFPNPANEYINLAINSTENINGTVTILDITGKTVFENNINVTAGYQQITLPTQKLVAGVYLVRVISEHNQQTMKFVKE